jgi:hypothetical protein
MRNYLFGLFAFVMLASVLWAGEPGRITRINMTMHKEVADRAVFEVHLVPAYSDQRIPRTGEVLPQFKENDIIIGGKKTDLRVIFDRVGVFKYKLEKMPIPDFITSIRLQERRGSYSNPDEMYTDDGREIKSAELSIRAKSGVYYQLLEMDRSQNNVLIVRFALQRITSADAALFKSIVTVDMTEIDTQAGVTVGPSINQTELLRRLETFPDETFVTFLYPLRYITPVRAQDIVKQKLSLLGSMGLDKENAALLVTDRADYARSLVQALALIDRPQPQVQITVKILEVSWQEEERIGFNWSFQTRSTSHDQAGNFQNGTYGGGALQTATSSVSGLSGASNVVFGKLNTEMARQIQAQLDLLSKKGKLSLLASPRLKVVNNTKAVFHAGSRIPVFRHTNRYRTNDSLETSTYNDDPKLTGVGEVDTRIMVRDSDDRSTQVEESINVGVQLQVTPRITQGEEIVLELTPSVSEIAGWRDSSNVPIIQTRELTSTVKVRDGETVLIAGLFKENELSDSRGVPGLRRLPGLGKFFRTDSKRKEKVETVFLLHIRRSQ